MTESELRQTVVSKAREYLSMETAAAHTRVMNAYNSLRPRPRGYALKTGDPWCAAFVSAVAADCALADMIPQECGCGPMIELYRAHPVSRWREDENYIPAPGDIVFYSWEDSGAGDCRADADHVGLVESVSDGVITVIEGNISGRVGRRRVDVNGRYLRGFGLPAYADNAAMLTADSAEEEFARAMERWLKNKEKEPPHAWSADARAWAESAGLVRGDGSGSMRYASPCTREEAAMMANRLVKLLGENRAP